MSLWDSYPNEEELMLIMLLDGWECQDSALRQSYTKAGAEVGVYKHVDAMCAARIWELDKKQAMVSTTFSSVKGLLIYLELCDDSEGIQDEPAVVRLGTRTKWQVESDME